MGSVRPVTAGAGGFRRGLSLAALALTVGEWALIVASATQLTPPHVSDFGMYYAAAALLRHNPSGDIYSSAALLGASARYGGCPQLIQPSYVYPPLLAVAMEPLTLLTCAQALVVWTLLNALLWALSAAMMASMLFRAFPGSRLAVWTLVIVGCALFWPAYPGLFLGQTHLLLLFLMLAGIWLERRDSPWLAGAALALAALVKPLPALLLVYYLARGRWKVVGGALIAGGLALVVMVAGSSAALVWASAPAAFGSTSTQARPGQDEALAIVAGPAGVALVAGAALAYLCVVAIRRRADVALGAMWTLCGMLLFSPVVWPFYLVWLLPVFAYALARAPARQRSRALYYAALGVLYVTLAIPAFAPAHPFATLALWAISGALYWDSGAGPRMEAEPAILPAGVI